MKEYLNKTINVINESINSMDFDLFNKLIDDCYECISKGGGKIIITALGKNVPIAEKFVGTMNSLNLDARFLHSNSAVHGDLGIVNDNDIVIFLSKSGNTIESIYLYNEVSKRKCKIYLISFNKTSKLNELIKNSIQLDLKTEGDAWNIVPNNSTSIYLILLQSIALELSKRFNITLDTFRKNHPGGAIGEILNAKVR